MSIETEDQSVCMTVADVPPAMREMVSNHEMLRRLGFLSEQIFAYSPEPETNAVGLVVMLSEDKHFKIRCGTYADGEVKFKELWVRLIRQIGTNIFKEEDLQYMFDHSMVSRFPQHLVNSLLSHGVDIPAFSKPAGNTEKYDHADCCSHQNKPTANCACPTHCCCKEHACKLSNKAVN